VNKEEIEAHRVDSLIPSVVSAEDAPYKLTISTEEIETIISEAIQKITKNPPKSKFYGDFDESKFMEGTFWTNGIGIKINGDYVEGVFRIQMDVKKAHRIIVLDTYGGGPGRVIGDRMYVYRIYLTVVE